MHTFSPHTKAESAKVNENFTDLSTGEGDVDSNRLELFRGETFVDYIQSGLIWTLVSGLNGTMTAGVVYIETPAGLMIRLDVATITSRTYTASKDTYVDLSYDGTISYVEVANGATTGYTKGANKIRIAKVVTNGSAITSITQSGVDGLLSRIYPRRPEDYPHYNALFYNTNSGNVFGAVQVRNQYNTYDTLQGYGITPTTGASAKLTVARDGIYKIDAHFRCIDVPATAFITWLYFSHPTDGTVALRRQDQAIGVGNGDTFGAMMFLKAGTDIYQEVYNGGGSTRFGYQNDAGVANQMLRIAAFSLVVTEMR